MKKLPLTQGYEAIVDDEDYEMLSQWRWKRLVSSRGHVYAARTKKESGKSSMLLMHRLIACAPPDMDVDHKNRDTLDNRRSNLRLCSRSYNNANAKARSDKKNSQYKGVQRNKKRWQARIVKDGVRYLLGTFDTELEAHQAYLAAAKKLYGEFAHDGR